MKTFYTVVLNNRGYLLTLNPWKSCRNKSAPKLFNFLGEYIFKSKLEAMSWWLDTIYYFYHSLFGSFLSWEIQDIRSKSFHHRSRITSLTSLIHILYFILVIHLKPEKLFVNYEHTRRNLNWYGYDVTSKFMKLNEFSMVSVKTS